MLGNDFMYTFTMLYKKKIKVSIAILSILFSGAVLEGFLRFPETTQDLSLDDGYAPFQLTGISFPFENMRDDIITLFYIN